MSLQKCSSWLFCLWRDSFSSCCIQTQVSNHSGEMMFIPGSQIPTFPSRARLTWNSTDASFIQLLQSLRNEPETAEEMFCAAVCILVTLWCLFSLFWCFQFCRCGSGHGVCWESRLSIRQQVPCIVFQLIQKRQSFPKRQMGGILGSALAGSYANGRFFFAFLLLKSPEKNGNY